MVGETRTGIRIKEETQQSNASRKAKAKQKEPRGKNNKVLHSLSNLRACSLFSDPKLFS